MLLDGGEMAFGDSPTANQRKPDAPVGDEGLGYEHRSGGLHDGGEDSSPLPCMALQRFPPLIASGVWRERAPVVIM
jgi:hypothetical protein